MSNIYLKKVAEKEKSNRALKTVATAAGAIGGIVLGRTLGAKAGVSIGRKIHGFKPNISDFTGSVSKMRTHIKKVENTATKVMQGGIIAGGVAGGTAGHVAAKKYSGQEKKAALDSLIQHGMDYDSAIVAIEKQAGLMSMAASAARKVMAAPVVGKAVNMGIKNPMRTAIGAGAVASGAGALLMRGGKEKQACVKMLMDQGVNFEEAVEMTKQASQELYGE